MKHNGLFHKSLHLMKSLWDCLHPSPLLMAKDVHIGGTAQVQTPSTLRLLDPSHTTHPTHLPHPCTHTHVCTQLPGTCSWCCSSHCCTYEEDFQNWSESYATHSSNTSYANYKVSCSTRYCSSSGRSPTITTTSESKNVCHVLSSALQACTCSDPTTVKACRYARQMTICQESGTTAMTYCPACSIWIHMHTQPQHNNLHYQFVHFWVQIPRICCLRETKVRDRNMSVVELHMPTGGFFCANPSHCHVPIVTTDPINVLIDFRMTSCRHATALWQSSSFLWVQGKCTLWSSLWSKSREAAHFEFCTLRHNMWRIDNQWPNLHVLGCTKKHLLNICICHKVLLITITYFQCNSVLHAACMTTLLTTDHTVLKVPSINIWYIGVSISKCVNLISVIKLDEVMERFWGLPYGAQQYHRVDIICGTYQSWLWPNSCKWYLSLWYGTRSVLHAPNLASTR